MHQVGANQGATKPHKISSEKSTPVAQGNLATVTVRKTKSTRKKWEEEEEEEEVEEEEETTTRQPAGVHLPWALKCCHPPRMG